MRGSIAQGTSQTHGNTHILHFVVRIPRRMEDLWPAVSTPEGLAAWFTAAEVLEPRLGGAVTLHGLGGGEVTAWDVDRVAEYTVEGGGRIRFHLERDSEGGTALRFTHEFQGEEEVEQRWRTRFERLIEITESPEGLPKPEPAPPTEPAPSAPSAPPAGPGASSEPVEPLPGQFT
ncbi:SRPBCC domain-containing protein [Streptomyces sp. SP2-10]|uniref:SRPBCC domain-containing protein n=1 Tax=Streptomyces sp. SP2-10 TaxID=2873385 RepID=UPI001CA5F82D|nr:SRPBCC domain-containing protein [Streptomyces sp. SP2-10]MBY8845149.1 SRPBCC domain-containing protein [Streptomyces sp. SP2-10]